MLTVNRLFGSNWVPRYCLTAAEHCSWLICWIRAIDGGRRIGPVLAAGERAHVDRFGDLEAVVVLAVDDLGRVGRAVRPVQAVAGLRMLEGVVAARSEGDRAGSEAVGALALWKRGDQPGNEEPTEGGQQQRAARRLGLQAAPPRRPRRGLLVHVR